MTTVTTEADLRAALLDGGDIVADLAVELAEPLVVGVAGTRVRGGRYRVASGPAWVGGVGGVELAELWVEGGGLAAGFEKGQRLVHLAGSQEAPLAGVVVRDCRLGESRGDAIRLEWCVDSQVRGVVVRGVLYAGVMVLSGDRVAVQGCTIADAPLTPGVVNTYGVAFTDSGNTEAARSRDCSVVGTVVRQVDWEGIDTHGGDGILVSGNTVVGCPRGVALVVGNETRTTVPTRCVVTGNSISARGMRVAPREGLVIGGLPGRDASAVITGNRIDGYRTPFRWGAHIGEIAVAGNNHPMIPWSRLDMTGSDFAPGLEYLVDGGEGRLRGQLVRVGLGDYVGRIPSPVGRPAVATRVSDTLTAFPDGSVRVSEPDSPDTGGTWRIR
ncbi:right-handed parallel beta-helix repeat-containing protein [Actinokineospora sp. NPDC004072]